MRILITQDTDWINNNPHQQHHVAERLSKRGHNIRVIDYEIRWKTSKDKNDKTMFLKNSSFRVFLNDFHIF